MKRIISFSLWGTDKRYLIGAIRNSELCNKIYPGWICRFYVDEDVDESIKKELLMNNSEIFIKKKNHEYSPYLWRFLSAADPEVDIMLSRDCDSRLSIREKVAVEEWLESDKNFHIIRDHPHHRYHIMAGMWGCRNKILNNIDSDINVWSNILNKQNDQIFLRDIIYPKIIHTSMIHDEFIKFEGNLCQRINHERENSEFIGEYFDENENISIYHRNELYNR